MVRRQRLTREIRFRADKEVQRMLDELHGEGTPMGDLNATQSGVLRRLIREAHARLFPKGSP